MIGDTYFWRVPRSTNSAQEDLWEGVFAFARRADGAQKAFKLGFPQPHPALMDDDESAAPIRPSDIAQAICERAARSKESGAAEGPSRSKQGAKSSGRETPSNRTRAPRSQSRRP